MKDCIDGFSDWPREQHNRPRLRDLPQAQLFAQLIYNKPEEQTLIEVYLNDCYIKLRDQRQQESPKIDEMMFLLAKARIYRACLEECERIKNEHLTIRV